MSERGKINNKEKQFIAGNWGHPRKFLKRQTNIPEPIIPENKHKKKKKKKKKPYISPFNSCPFCNNELPLDAEKINKIKLGPFLFKYQWSLPRVKICPICKAYEIKEPDICPACKRNYKVWKNTEGIYKHQSIGCGFTGKKKKNLDK